VKDGERGVLIVRFSDGRASGDAFAVFNSENDLKKALEKDRTSMGTRYVELFRSSVKEFQLVWTVNTWSLLLLICSVHSTCFCVFCDVCVFVCWFSLSKPLLPGSESLRYCGATATLYRYAWPRWGWRLRWRWSEGEGEKLCEAPGTAMVC